MDASDGYKNTGQIKRSPISKFHDSVVLTGNKQQRRILIYTNIKLSQKDV